MEDRQLEARESFELISRMINNTRQRMELHAGRPFLIWGYTTVIVTAAVWIALAATHNALWNLLWFSIPALGWPLMYLTGRKSAQGSVHTYVDTVISQIWYVLGFAGLLIPLVPSLLSVNLPILFIVLLLMSIGTAITGLVIRFTPTSVAGFIGIVLAPFLLIGGHWMFGLFIAGFTITMIIPGHILNDRAKHQKNE